MRVFVGTDHAGLEFKEHLKQALAEAGHEPVDCGAHEYDPQDDYPPFCFEVGERVVVEPGSLGVVIGGSGNGEQIAANKVPGVRAALVLHVLASPWSGEERHARRIGLIHDYERDRHRPAGGLPTRTPGSSLRREPAPLAADGAAVQAAWALGGSRPDWPLSIAARPDADYRPIIREQYAARLPQP